MSTGIEGDCGQILSLELSPLDYSDTTDAFNGDDDENDYDTNDTIDMEERYNNNPITDSNVPLLRPIIALALPSAIQSILSNAYGFNSFVFVGHMRDRELSSIATTALSSIVGVNIVIFAFHNIIPSGANTHTSQYVGAENPGMVRLCFRSAFYSSIALSSIVGLLGFIFIDHISAVCNSDDPRVREAIGEYLGIVFLTSPFFSFMLLVDGYFKSVGDVATPFYLECLSLVLNTIMNYLLVVHFDYGIGGSAIATSIARLLPALFGLYKILFQTNQGIMVSLSMLQNLPQERPANETMEMTTNGEKYRNDVEDDNVFDDNITTERHQPTLFSNLLFILYNSIGMARIGVFDSLAAFIYGVCFTSLVRICGLIGVAQQAGLGAGLRGIEWLGFCLSEGFLVAAATAVGQCVGANAHERAMDVAIVLFTLGSCGGSIWFAFCILFCRDITTAFER